MSQQWHVSKAGLPHGPFTSGQLKKLAESGQLATTDLVWNDGLDEWVTASSVEGLFPESAEVKTAPPMPRTLPPAAPLVADYTDAPVPKSRLDVVRTSDRHKQRIGILIAASLGISATFLPWVHAPILGSVAGTAGDGWITLVLFLPAVILALRGDKSVAIHGRKRDALALPAVLAALLGVWKIIDFQKLKANAPDDNPFVKAIAVSVQIGFGLYLLVAAGIAVAVVAWALDKNNESSQAKL